jgi:GNAT superfamily N-acetyltransferase
MSDCLVNDLREVPVPVANHEVDKALIRGIEPRDYERWLALWDGYNAFYERAGPTALPAEITQSTWSLLLDPSESVNGLVAERNGELVGLAHYIFHRSTILLTPTCYLQDLFTSTQARGRGVGRALIEEVYRRARMAGSTRVYWHTHESNAVARQLYERISVLSGFVVYRTNI